MGLETDLPCGYSSLQLDYSLSMGQVDGLPHPGSMVPHQSAHRWAILEHHVQDGTAFGMFNSDVSIRPLDC